jgi:hypothetical protein
MTAQLAAIAGLAAAWFPLVALVRRWDRRKK